MIVLQGADHAGAAGVPEPVLTPLRRLCAEIELAVQSCLEERERAVANALRPFLVIADLLRETQCPCSAERYVRHLLHAGDDYTVLALVWRPGQMSPVHGHRSWCALGIHRGSMTEALFSIGSVAPVPRGCVQHNVGDVSHAAADPGAIHRLANLGTETAVSIHVYGARYDRLGEEVNHVWAA